MDIQGLYLWASRGGQTRRVTNTMTTAPVQLYPANPMRAFFIVSSASAGVLHIELTHSPTGYGTFIMNIGATQPIIGWHNVGQLITEPIWASGSNTSAVVDFIEISYEPNRFGIVQRLIDEYVSSLASR